MKDSRSDAQTTIVEMELLIDYDFLQLRATFACCFPQRALSCQACSWCAVYSRRNLNSSRPSRLPPRVFSKQTILVCAKRGVIIPTARILYVRTRGPVVKARFLCAVLVRLFSSARTSERPVSPSSTIPRVAYAPGGVFLVLSHCERVPNKC